MSKCAECGANLFHTSFCGVPYRDKERDKFHSQIRELTAERDKYRDACERLIGHYGLRPELWICQVSSCVDADCEHPDILYLSNDGHGNGYDFARQVKAEIDTNAE